MFEEFFLERLEITSIDSYFTFNIFVVFFIHYFCIELIHDISHDRNKIEVIAEFYVFRDFLLNDFAMFYDLFCAITVGLNKSSDAE